MSLLKALVSSHLYQQQDNSPSLLSVVQPVREQTGSAMALSVAYLGTGAAAWLSYTVMKVCMRFGRRREIHHLFLVRWVTLSSLLKVLLGVMHTGDLLLYDEISTVSSEYHSRQLRSIVSLPVEVTFGSHCRILQGTYRGFASLKSKHLNWTTMVAATKFVRRVGVLLLA